jgi:hypothetical protein
MGPLRIVIGNTSLARYGQGGGHWIIRIQYLLGLRALGHHPVLLALLWSSGETSRDEASIGSFFSRLEEYGLKECAAALLLPGESKEQNLEKARAYGRSMAEVKDLIAHADLFWNDCCHVRQPLLGMFPYRVLMDLDPGHLQVSALEWNMDLADHHRLLTIGIKLNDPDCLVPKLGLQWKTCTPFVYLPLWSVEGDADSHGPFTSITHWNWGELRYQGRVLSISKRAGYLRYLELPRLAGRPFQLAAVIHARKEADDRAALTEHGWSVVDPWEVACSPVAYQSYIRASRAEISCPKPIFRDLHTGWFSDRSACYLASGRPVLAEDTGFSDYFPSGEGLLAFRNMEEAVAGVAAIDSDYPRHARAARRFAEEFLDSNRCLEAILAACS